jgi:two-component system sensor histidine kinase RegB
VSGELAQVEKTPPNMAWLVRLRWMAAVSQALAVAVVSRWVDMSLSTRPLLLVVAVTMLTNIGLSLWLRRDPRIEEWMLAAVMALDFLLLTALLYLSGGPSNPFTVLYLVHIALAAVVLEARYAWALSLLSTACFAALFLLPPAHGALDHEMAMQHGMHHGMQHGGDAPMSLHLRGMWVAFFVAATVIAYFVTRVTRDLALQRAAAAEAKNRALRSERLAALATLAAGAAHELATPLGTIAVVAKELERELSGPLDGSRLGTAADARLIREEVDRCKEILSQMASDAGESAGEAFAPTKLRALVELALEAVTERERVHVSIEGDANVHVPPRAFARALRGLVRNALQASDQAVQVQVQASPKRVEIAIIDHGTGMSEELLARVGEPFFTTKEPGRGMGLGVFLARALAERLGGSLELSSQLKQGTKVRVLLPQHTRAADRLNRAL